MGEAQDRIAAKLHAGEEVLSLSAVERLALANAEMPQLDEEDWTLIALACDELSDPNLIELKGKLDWSPKSNWVEDAGGLPKDIESMAIHIMESGVERSHAIAAAIQRAKVLAAKGKARWIKAVAAWEALKAKARAKKD